MSDFHGAFVWYEHITSDTKVAEMFYSAVVGWKAHDSGMPGVKYTLFGMNGLDVAGMVSMSDIGMPQGHPFWTGYIAVDNVDESAAKLKQDGGSVYREPMDIPGVGRFAIVADPQGAAFALFHPQPTEGPRPDNSQTPGFAGWRELRANDGPSAVEFYCKHFGWTKDHAMDMGPDGVYQILAQKGVQFGAIMTKPAQMPAPTWLFYFNVDDITAAEARVRAEKGAVLFGPQEVPGGLFVLNCTDPLGGHFALVGPRRG